VPDFGVRTAISEFGKAVEGKRFRHPETNNMVLYTSLPMDEQHRIYEQWKQYKAMVETAPKEGRKVTDIKSLKKGDSISVQGPKSKIHALIVGESGGNLVAKKVDPKTGKLTQDKAFSISQDAVEAFDVRALGSASASSKPFKNRDQWADVDLEDVYDDDLVAYRHGGKDRMGRVVRVSPEKDKFWVREVDPRSGKVLGKQEYSFDAAKIKDREAKLVDVEDDPVEKLPSYGWTPSSGAGWGPSNWKPKKPLTPEEKKKLEEEKKKAEAERKRREAERKKAVEKMSETGSPVKSTKDIKVGDVISYHWDGGVYHGRVIDSRGHEFFTIDIDPETGKLKEHGFEEWRGYNLQQNDVHKLDEKHVPEDPREENEKALYDALPKLEEDPDKYFQRPKDSKLVEMSKIKPAKVRLKGVLNANDLLALAAKGKQGKRSPISLVDNEDGTYTVRDGNSTYTNASLSGWEKIPAVVKTQKEWEEEEKREEERKKELLEQQKFKFPSKGWYGGVTVTKEEAPKKRPAKFKGKKLKSVEGMKKGDLFGYEHRGRWYVGKVDRVGKDGDVHVDSLHPENGELTTTKYIRFNDDKLKDSKAVRLENYEFPKQKPAFMAPPKLPPKLPPKKKPQGGGGSPGSGKPFLFASRRAALEEMRVLLADLRQAYRPLWQDTPGYKTVVDVDSDKGIYPAQTESTSLDRGQDNLDATWPVQPPQSREKERALPLPSNHSKNREKRIGPTNYNKPRKIPYRTLSEPGEEYGHPTKYDYNYVTRRQDVTAFDDDEDVLEPVAVQRRQGPFPKKHQQNQGGPARLKSKQWYLRNPAHKRKMRMKYQLKDKRKPREKLKDKYYRMYPKRYERRGRGFTTPAERTKAWREENKAEARRKGISRLNERAKEREKRQKEREQRRTAGLELLADALEILGLEMEGAYWPSNWNTQVKKTAPPEQLDQNYGKGQSRDTGTPRTDKSKQRGESLRAPDLSSKKQKGLKWELEPPASGGLDYPTVTTNNPTDGSGKVLPMSYYTDFANNTQEVPDGRQDRYLRNNNFDVKVGHEKVALSVGEILSRCDSKIKRRSREYTPKLKRIDTKNWIWHWGVGDYTVRVQAFKRGRAVNFPKLNLKVSCTCPYWRWWGPAHWATREDYQKGKAPGTAQYPKVRDPAHWRPVCKHAYAVLEKSKDFFVRPQKSPLKKLGSRFSVDSLEDVEVELERPSIEARVAQASLERQISRRVARRYVETEES
jgi:hypothetical protein